MRLRLIHYLVYLTGSHYTIEMTGLYFTATALYLSIILLYCITQVDEFVYTCLCPSFFNAGKASTSAFVHGKEWE